MKKREKAQQILVAVSVHEKAQKKARKLKTTLRSMTETALTQYMASLDNRTITAPPAQSQS